MPNEPNYSIAAVFRDRAAAEAAIADLETTGLDAQNVHLTAQGGAETVPTVTPVPVANTYLGGINSLNSAGFAPGLGAAALVGLTEKDEEWTALHSRLERGEALVAVAAGERAAIVRTVLERNGGEIVER